MIRRSEPARHMLSIPHYNDKCLILYAFISSIRLQKRLTYPETLIKFYNYKQHKSFTHLSNSFFYSAPRLWNSLPETCRCASSLGSLRAHLKTYLWTKSFPAIAFCHVNISGWFLTYFPTTDYGFDCPNDLCVQNAFLMQIRRYRNTTD